MSNRLLRPALVSTLLGVALVTSGCTGTSPDPAAPVAGASAQTLGVDEFAAVVAEPDVVLLDVRTPAEFAEGHLEGATNLDIASPEFEAAVEALPKDAAYAVYCRSGNRSAQAVETMLRSGIVDVVHLDGGIGAWASSGGAVVTTP